jgi:RHS repeat-associated protein
MANGQLNSIDNPDQTEFERLAADYRAKNYSYNGRDDDARQAIAAYFRENRATADSQSRILEKLGSDPDTIASVNRYFQQFQFDPSTIEADPSAITGTGDGSSTVQLDGAPTGGTKTVATEPVDLTTGQFVQTITDAVVPGAGMDFAFVRTYRSASMYPGPMGWNWDHSCNLWLRVNADNSVSVTTGQVREIRYLLHQDFPYYVAIADERIVTATTDNAFEQRSAQGVVARFEQVGDADGTIYRVVRISDRFNNALAFSYDDQIRLSEVTVNNLARVVTFGYDDNSRITTVTLFSATYSTGSVLAAIRRVWSYTYDDFSDLVAVTAPATDEFPAGRTTQYAYSSPLSFAQRQHDLLSITDGNGATYLENEYGDSPGTAAYGKVVRQRVGSGVFLLEYAQVLRDPAWTFSDSDRPTSCVTVVQRDGHPVRYVLNALGNILAFQETVLSAGEETVVWRYAYDADGRRIATMSPEGRVTQIYYGREDFYRRAISPGDASVPMWQDPNLSAAEHGRFGNLIATVQRSQILTLAGLLDEVAIYGNVFPDVLVVVPDDIILKRSYESTFQQLATISDPRYTASPDPAGPEPLAYSHHLTVVTFNGDPGATPAAVTYPDTTYPLPLPNGATGVVRARKTFDRYDANGRLLQWTEPEGNIFAYGYFPADPVKPTAEGFLASSTAGVGVLNLQTSFAINEAGQVVAVTDPRGSATQYAIDAFSLLRAVTPPLPGYQTTYAYDGDAQIVSRATAIIDPDRSVAVGSPEVATFAYNEERSVVLATLGDSTAISSRRTKRVYDTSNRLITLVMPRGNSTCYEYDERSLLKAVTRGCCAPEAATNSYGYDLDGAAVSITDPLGHVTTTKLDAFARPIGVTDALGNLQRTDFDKLGNAIVHRMFGARVAGNYPLLRHSEYLYDERSQLIRERRAYFTTPISTSDPWGNPDAEFNTAARGGNVQFYDTLYYFDGNLRGFRIVDANGHASALAYDAANRLVKITDPVGNSTTLTYDAANNLMRRDRYLVDSTGVTRGVISTAYEFDSLNRLTATIDGAGNRFAQGFDSRNLLRTVTNPLGHVKKYGYNNFRDQVTAAEVLLPLATGGPSTDLTTTRSFDANSNITAVTDPAGNTTVFEYDPLDRLKRVINPDGTSRTMSYDRSSNLAVAVDEESVRVLRTFDALNRLTAITVQAPLPIAASAERSAAFSYDGASTLLGHQNDFLSVAKRCDSLGRCHQEDLSFGPPFSALAGPVIITSQFDAVSNRTGLGYPSGQVLSYNFGADDRLVQITSTANAGNYPGDPGAPPNRLILQKQRWSELTVAKTLGNGVAIASAYDAAGRPISEDCSLANGQEFLLQQLWDGAGNRALDIEKYAGTATGWRRAYDSTNRLIESETLRRPRPVATGPLSPPIAPVPIAAFRCQTVVDAIISGYRVYPRAQPDFGYDAVGNRTSQRVGSRTRLYHTNVRNEYVSVGNTSFGYDRVGRLVDDTKFTFVYNFRGQLVQATSRANGNVTLRVFHDAIGRPIGIVERGQTRALVFDGAAAIEAYDDGVLSAVHIREDEDRLCFFAAGGMDQYVCRDVLGSTRLISNSHGAASDILRYDPFGSLLVGNLATQFLYSGKYLYSSIGWYEYRARQYVPDLGRFAQPDPMGFADGANLFTFVTNNPLSATDPSGTDEKRVIERGAESTPEERRSALLASGVPVLERNRDPDYVVERQAELTRLRTEALHQAGLKWDDVPSIQRSSDVLSGAANITQSWLASILSWFGKSTDEKMNLAALGANIQQFDSLAAPLAGAIKRRISMVASAAAVEATTGTASVKMAQTPSEVFGDLVKFRDEELVAMRNLYPEFLGPGRLDPALELGGANKGTWFGNILNERVRQRVIAAIKEGTLTPQLQFTRQGQQGIDFWLQGTPTGYDLFPAQGRYLIQHEASYVGKPAPDGTVIQEVLPLLYSR